MIPTSFDPNWVKDAFQELQLYIVAAVAQFEWALILERQREGIVVAKRNGKYLGVGRKSSLTEIQRQILSAKLKAGEKVVNLAREFGVSR
ncbi:MAG: recombinase family protein [Deltaproteobacteria bacterium]|jgi:DNA invertase Pin-like site-specific DNA recombinase|nr:recombinase family protein [Deltaproteobacteria bacterium]